jgi:hypothetical protein
MSDERFVTDDGLNLEAAVRLLIHRVDALENELAAWRAVSPYKDGRPPIVFAPRSIPDLFDPEG